MLISLDILLFGEQIKMVKTAIDAVFLALKKVGVGQYEDSDSKPAVGVSTQAQLLAKAGQWRSQMQGVQGFFFGGGEVLVASSDI